MTWDDIQSGGAAAEPTAPPPAPIRRPGGLRRALLTAGIAGALLVTGGVAVVFAASPDPSPGAPSTTTPSNGRAARPDRAAGAPRPRRHHRPERRHHRPIRGTPQRTAVSEHGRLQRTGQLWRPVGPA